MYANRVLLKIEMVYTNTYNVLGAVYWQEHMLILYITLSSYYMYHNMVLIENNVLFNQIAKLWINHDL